MSERMLEDMPERMPQLMFQYMPENLQIEKSWWGPLELKELVFLQTWGW